MSTRHSLITLAGSLLWAATLHAEDPAAAKAEPAPEPYQLKNRSHFTCAGEDARAPFWPIGWVHRKGVAASVSQATAPKSALDEKSFRVTSILLGTGATPSLAVINGRAYSEGEFLKMPRAAAAAPGKPASPPAVRIRVQRINDGSIVLQREDQVVTIPMQRQELTEKKIEEPLLDEER